MRYAAAVFLAVLFVARAAAPDLAGRYSGDWKSNGSGGNGSFRMNLEHGDGGAWKGDVTFTFGGAEVKTVTREVKVADSRVEISYDFDLIGNELRSRVTGEWNGKGFEGKYQTTSVDGSTPVDEGVWSAAPAK